MHCVAVDGLLCVLETKTFYTGLKPNCDCFLNKSYCQNSLMFFIPPAVCPSTLSTLYHNKLVIMHAHTHHGGIIIPPCPRIYIF